MNIMGFLIGTVVLWVLTYAISVPIAKALIGSGGSQPNALALSSAQTSRGAGSTGTSQTVKQLDEIDSVPTGAFVLVHVLVLGLAGFLMGALAGVYFIGFAWKAKLWPGMIALMIASIVAAM
jgi:hypothetical protein